MPNRNKPNQLIEKTRGPDRKLTRRQELFVKELVSNDGQITLREAATKAGYPPKSAHTRAYELTNPNICPHVVQEIRRYREELDEMYQVGYKKHVRDLQRIRDLALENGAYSAAVQAEYRRGQAQGDIYVSKSEIRTGSIDQMSKEDVERELERIREGFERAPVIDITPEPSAEETGPGGKKQGKPSLEKNKGRRKTRKRPAGGDASGKLVDPGSP